MLHQETQSPLADTGTSPDTLSNEILKLKMDDLFHEIEGLKKRIARLEGRGGEMEESATELIPQTEGVVNDLERFSGAPRG
jgi:hypothetical protein